MKPDLPSASLLALLPALAVALATAPLRAPADEPPRPAGCVACHEQLEPRVVADWRASAHARSDVGCEACHGRGHGAADDVA